MYSRIALAPSGKPHGVAMHVEQRAVEYLGTRDTRPPPNDDQRKELPCVDAESSAIEPILGK
jgi:hypothetical protein